MGDAIVSDGRGPATASKISFVTSLTLSDSATVTAASALTTYTSYSTSTYVSGGTTYIKSSGLPVIVSDAAQFSSLSAAGAFNPPASSSSTASSTAAATATATSSAASTHKSSPSHTSTLVPAIIIPVVVVLLASFVTFFFFMRRRHHRALEEEARFEKAKATSSRPLAADNSSSRHLLPAGAAYGHGADEKPPSGAPAPARALVDSLATSPPRPRRPDESDIPSSAIGIARTTSSASAVYPNGGARPPRSAHEMRGLPSQARLDQRVPRSEVISSGDIIDSYADMRPSTAPSGGHRDYSSRSEVMRTPLPTKPMGRPPPKNSNPPVTAPAPAAWPVPAHTQPGPGTAEDRYGLTEENLRTARLAHGASAARPTPDDASISDVDEHDRARAHRDDASDISSLYEEPERTPSGTTTPIGTGWGTPMSGRVFIR